MSYELLSGDWGFFFCPFCLFCFYPSELFYHSLTHALKQPEEDENNLVEEEKNKAGKKERRETTYLFSISTIYHR